MPGERGRGARAVRGRALSREPLRPRAAYKVWRTIPTRWADNDVYGHVNNVVYYAWVDTAVNAWLIESGLLAPGAPIGLVVETGCRYAHPLSFPERVEIALAVERLGTSSVRYALGIFREAAAEAAAEAHFVHAYVDAESRRPVPLPPAWRAALEGIALA